MAMQQQDLSVMYENTFICLSVNHSTMRTRAQKICSQSFDNVVWQSKANAEKRGKTQCRLNGCESYIFIALTTDQ